jgi:hypothetical protein
MAVRMGGSLGNIKVPEEVGGETQLVTKLKAVGVITGQGADGSDTITITADGTKTLAQLVQENAVFSQITSAVPDPQVSQQAGLAHVPAAGVELKVTVAFSAQSIEAPPE